MKKKNSKGEFEDKIVGNVKRQKTRKMTFAKNRRNEASNANK